MTTSAQGLLVVYTGAGKGKTTAALGMVFRALGRGLRVAVVQFVKGRWETGERALAERLPGLAFHVMGEGFTWEGDERAHAEAARRAWAVARELVVGGAHDLVVLDELTYPVAYGWVPVPEVLGAMAARRGVTHVVVTGRDAPAALVEAADLVTEMREVKHPFARGGKAQPGVDF